MSRKSWFDGAKPGRPIVPRALDAEPVTGRTPGPGTEAVVCYCGLYDACPHWDEMTVDERRACSADKRMTTEWLWRAGVRRV